MTEREKQRLLALASIYKEQVCEKLQNFLPERLNHIRAEELQGLPLDKVLAMYMQGVGQCGWEFAAHKQEEGSHG